MEGLLKIKSGVLINGWKLYYAILDQNKPELLFLKNSFSGKPALRLNMAKDI